MQSEVFVRDLRRRAVPALGIGVALALLAAFALGLYSTFSAEAERALSGLGENFDAFINSTAPGGYVMGELFDLLAPLALVGYAVGAGANAIAGEEGDGTLGLLMAQPVTRTGVAVAKAAGVLAALVAAAALVWGGVRLAGVASDVDLEAASVGAAVVHLGLLAVAFGMLAFAAGAVSGRTSVAAGAAGGLAVASYLSATMLPLAELDFWARFSPWYYYNGSEPLTHGFDVAHLLVLGAIAVVALAAAVAGLNRRDLRG